MALKGHTAWNKGLKIRDRYPQMGFRKGNTEWDNKKTIKNQFKKGLVVSPSTMFKKGQESWNKGLKGFNAGSTNHFWKGGKMFWKISEKKHLCSKYRDW